MKAEVVVAVDVGMLHRRKWSPREDISVYELALALPALMYLASDKGIGSIQIEAFNALPDGVKRHFEIA